MNQPLLLDPIFFWEGTGHLAMTLPSSKANNRICDCFDGADELQFENHINTYRDLRTATCEGDA